MEQTAPRSKLTTEQGRQARDLGAMGERLATRFLLDQGYAILEKNYRQGKYEIDLIALDGPQLVVVEVKTRSNTDYSAPEEAVDHRKRGFIIKLAHQYMLNHQRQEEVRFDILAIVVGGDEPAINHIKDAYNVLSY